MPTSQPIRAEEQTAIRDELDKILSSEFFVNANRLSSLLSYVVEEALAGRRERIKAFSIAQDVFDRDANFDQQRDPIVRVEASRLRKTLERYYESCGAENGIRIDIPKGGYAPTFSRRKTPEIASDNRIWSKPFLFGLVGLVLLLGIWLSSLVGDTGAGSRVGAQDRFLAILPLSHDSSDLRAAGLQKNLVDSTITMLANAPNLSVMAHASMMEFEPNEVSIRSLRSDYGVTHILRGSIETSAEDLRLRIQLIEAESSETIWSESLEGAISSIWSLQDKLALDVLAALSIPPGVADRELVLNRFTESTEALTLYRQGLFMILPPNERKRVDASRQLFDRVIEIDPNFAGGYAGKSWSYSLPVVFHATQTPKENLIEALSYAERAVEVDPTFGASHVTLGFTQVLMGNSIEALENTQLAIAMQPGDEFVQFLRAATLVIAGLPGEAFIPLDEAIRINPLEIRAPYLNFYGIAKYANKEYRASLDMIARNQKRGGPQGPHMEIFRAAAYTQLGEDAKASAIINTLNESFPQYPYLDWLSSWITPGEHLRSTAEGLSRNGLCAENC